MSESLSTIGPKLRNQVRLSRTRQPRRAPTSPDSFQPRSLENELKIQDRTCLGGPDTGQTTALKPRGLPSPAFSPGQKLGLFQRLGQAFRHFLAGDSLKDLRTQLKEINELEASARALKTPDDFQARTTELREKVKSGVPLEQIRNEAYAVARQAAVVATGMRPYDVQILGALAMDDGRIAEMRTGEGKTLTAIMPLYLNALAGKGAHLVTVNDTLAKRDRDFAAPILKLLGMSCECVLEGMSKDEKRAAYNADITYVTDRTLGFDYLRDRTAKRPESKVLREPYFALVDEVDEVLIDEARTPLIISGMGQPASPDFKVFNEIVRGLTPGDDFYVEPEKNAAWLTETGLVRVENQLMLGELKQAGSQDSQAEISQREKLNRLLSEEQKALRPVKQLEGEEPGLLERLSGANFDEKELKQAEKTHQAARTARQELEASLPSYSLYSSENLHRTRNLEAALRAHATLVKDHDYIVADNAVHIVDANKGRTSEGRRYNDGIHQALEAKEGVPIQDEQRTVASITYPNLFKKYPRLAGMSGTAKTSEHEFVQLYELDVVPIPTNEPVIRQDQPDILFPTLQDKYAAVARDAAKDFFAGRPVLVGTLTVEHNLYVAQALEKAGVPPEAIQVLNAQSVRGDKSKENEIISGAGRSGVITVATNMAGRGADIKPDLVNFQQLSMDVFKAVESGHGATVELENLEQAQWLEQWLGELGTTITPAKQGDSVTLSVGDPENATLLRGDDYPTGGLTVYGTARGSSARVDNQLIGRAGRQGDPGRSRFYLSLEDELFSHLSPDDRADLLEAVQSAGGSLSGDRVRKEVEHAQGIAEANDFSIREKTTKNDSVLNSQREAYFGYRDELLTSGPAIREQFADLVADGLIDAMASQLPDRGSFTYAQIGEACARVAGELKLPMGLPFLDPALGHPPDTRMKAEDLENEVRVYARDLSRWTLERMKLTTPDVEAALRKELLAITDVSWSEHLMAMEAVEEGIGWQALAQKDPEVEYKLQGFEVFKETVGAVRHRTAAVFMPHLVSTARQIDQQVRSRPNP